LTRGATPADVDAIWRIESARVIASVARMVRDVGLAEDLAQDAVVAALETWPRDGVPPNPGGWLTQTAKNRAIDMMRRRASLQDKYALLARSMAGEDVVAGEQPLRIDDDVLRLLFTCCHPVLPREARVALTLRMLGGLKTPEIARAFLVPEATVGQRISRAKRTLADSGVAFEAPGTDDLDARLGAVLEVVYLVFNEGYAATAGEDWMRPALMEEAMRLGRVLASLAPDEPEVHGLVALMELQASRARARVDASGAPILLEDQDRARWDRLLIVRGLAALQRAEALGKPFGPYGLQAAIAAEHARAPRAEETNWMRIAALYELLMKLVDSPVVALNGAVAIGRAFTPELGLAAVNRIVESGALDDYHLLFAVRGDLLERLGRADEASAAFEQAAALASNARERELVRARAADVSASRTDTSARAARPER
jgi:RNA polymerase sigma-70 factor, ECF subfamily